VRSNVDYVLTKPTYVPARCNTEALCPATTRANTQFPSHVDHKETAEKSSIQYIHNKHRLSQAHVEETMYLSAYDSSIPLATTIVSAK
jgi:hypothetical protein